MTILNADPIAFDWKQFSNHHGSLVCEASTLGFTAARGGGEAMLRRIYDDACDVGIAVRGRAKTIWFYLEGTDKDGEGDVAGWRFKPIPEHVRRWPEVTNCTVLIIND